MGCPGRQTGKRAIPTETAAQAIAAYAGGRSQAQVREMLAEAGYPVHIGTVRRLLTGKTYKTLARPTPEEHAAGKAAAARSQRRRPMANLLTTRDMPRVQTSGPRPGAGQGQRTPLPGTAGNPASRLPNRRKGRRRRV